MSTISSYLLLAPNFAYFAQELNIIGTQNNQHTHTFHCDPLPPHAPPCPLQITPVTPNKFWGNKMDFWGNYVTSLITLLGVSYPKKGVMKMGNCQRSIYQLNITAYITSWLISTNSLMSCCVYMQPIVCIKPLQSWTCSPPYVPHFLLSNSNKLQHLVDNDIFEDGGTFNWALPCFIID